MEIGKFEFNFDNLWKDIDSVNLIDIDITSWGLLIVVLNFRIEVLW